MKLVMQWLIRYILFLLIPRPPRATLTNKLCPYTTPFRSHRPAGESDERGCADHLDDRALREIAERHAVGPIPLGSGPKNSTFEASKWRRYRVRAGAAGR